MAAMTSSCVNECASCTFPAGAALALPLAAEGFGAGPAVTVFGFEDTDTFGFEFPDAADCGVVPDFEVAADFGVFGVAAFGVFGVAALLAVFFEAETFRVFSTTDSDKRRFFPADDGAPSQSSSESSTS